jgi:hypothetical protein
MGININLLDIVPKVLRDILSKYTNDKLINRYGLLIWKRNIVTVAEKNDILNKKQAQHLSESRALLRLYYKIFEQGTKIDFKTFTLSLAMECIDKNIPLNQKEILQFSKAIMNSWYKVFTNNKILSECFQAFSEEPISKPTINDDEEEELLIILEDKFLIRKNFFSSYAVQIKSNSFIRVHLPDRYKVVSYNEELYVDVYVNPWEEFELGFYRIGYDYVYLPGSQFANYVSLSKDKKREVVEFRNIRNGVPTKHRIWAR